MPLRHRLGYRLNGFRRLYGLIFNYRTANAIPPLSSMVLQVVPEKDGSGTYLMSSSLHLTKEFFKAR